MRIAVLGGGIGGLSLAWFLSRRTRGAWAIDVYEKEAMIGGLVRAFEHRGRSYDQHYHCVLVSDRVLLDLLEALDLGDQVDYCVSRMGFYDGRRLLPFDNPMDMLRFPLLTLADKARLVATILYCRRFGRLEDLHERSLEEWLVALGGRRTFERVWAPLLRSRFDGGFEGIPATYIWSRLRRMSSTREGGGAVERLGIVRGGTSTLVRRLAERLGAEGVGLRTHSAVRRLEKAGAKTLVEDVSGRRTAYDCIISTLPTPVHDKLATPAGAMAVYPMPTRYLGIVDVVVALDRPLSPYYTINLLDPTLPFTGIVETTNLMPSAERRGTHMVYLPRYTETGGALYREEDSSVKARFVRALLGIFPGLDSGAIQGTYVFRAPYVEPIHHRASVYVSFPDSLKTRRLGVYLMNTGRLYPALHNCQAVVELASRTADFMVERHG